MIASEIEDALRSHEPHIEERYITAALVESDRRPEILECYPPSVVASVAISERVGIPVDSRVGAAYLSVQRRGKKKEAVYFPGYPAFPHVMKMADPEIVFADAQIVRERDDFRFEHTTAPVFVMPSRPRVSRFLQGLVTLAGIAPVDGFRHIPYSGENAGGVVSVYAYAVYRSGVTKRVLLLRNELSSIPETEWGTESGQWKLRGRALRTLCKTLVRTPEMGALIYLARDDESVGYTPRSLDVCRTFGITVYEQPAEMRGEPAIQGHAAKVATPSEPFRTETVESSLQRCCGCGSLNKDVGPLIIFSVHPKALRASGGCKGCGGLGVEHDLCRECLHQHGQAKREIEAEEEKDQKAREGRAIAIRAAAARSTTVSERVKRQKKPRTLAEGMGLTPGSHDLAPEPRAKDSESSFNGSAEIHGEPTNQEDGSTDLSPPVSVGSAGPVSSSGGAA